MRIGFVGGGSGGHFYPLIAVAEVLELQAPTVELYYFGPAPYDLALLQKHNIKYVYTPAGKLRRYFSIQNFLDIFRSIGGLFVAIYKLYIIYPDVIFSKGGFTSVPILVAARFLRIPIVIHESDSVPGRANKLAKGFARYIAISYKEAASFFPSDKTALVGIPLRKEIVDISTNPHEQLGIPNDKPLLYVTGGSLGAERINSVIETAILDLLPHYRVFHQTGATTFDSTRLTIEKLLAESPLQQYYYIVPSVDAKTVSLLLDAATLVITRAGSTTLFEIAAHGKPAIVIPIPEEVSHDQRSNAYAYANTGAGTVIEEKNLTPHLLTTEIQSIINDPNRYQNMSLAAKSFGEEGAASKIAQLLISIVQEHD